jgi:GNAT superfamily N-acetyltransferase
MSTPVDCDDKKYPVGYEKWVTLKTGEMTFVRPVKESDGALLTDLFSKLSQQTIYWRFFTHRSDLPDDLLFRFTHMDYVKNFALLAIIYEDLIESAIAVGRYVWDSETQMPELAFVVRDDWQGKGLGTILFLHIVEAAKKNGFIRFQASVESANTAMRKLFAKSNIPHVVSYKVGISYYEFDVSGMSILTI